MAPREIYAQQVPTGNKCVLPGTIPRRKGFCAKIWFEIKFIPEAIQKIFFIHVTMNQKLKGKNVLITAGAQGIGESITKLFIDQGANVAIHYFSSSERAEQLKEVLLKADGFLPLHDQSSAEEIKDRLGMSKKSFKRATGILYKNRDIEFVEDGIRLINSWLFLFSESAKFTTFTCPKLKSGLSPAMN